MLPLVTVSPAKPLVADGLIVAVTFLVPLLVGLATGRPEQTVIVGAVAAMVVATAPHQLPLGPRIRVMVIVTFTTTAMMFLGALASPHVWLAGLFMAALGVATGLVSLFGAGGVALSLMLGPLSLLVLTITESTIVKAEELALAALIGGIWAIPVGTAAMIVRREHPERQSVVRLYATVADMVDAVARGDAAALSKARFQSGPALETALTATGDRQRDLIGRATALIIEIIRLHASVGDQLSDEAVTALRALADHLRQRPGAAPPAELVEQLRRSYLENLAVVVERDEPESGAILMKTPSAIERLVANLSWDSLIFRFSMRFGITAGVTLAIVRWLDVPEGPWIVLTIVVVLKPDVGGTFDRIMTRVAGTIVGALIAGVIIVAIGDQPYVLAIIATAFLAVMVATLPLNYAFWSVTITPLVLIILALTGTEGWAEVGWRILHTIIGGLIAFAATRLLWPSPAGPKLPALVANDVKAISRYLSAIADSNGADLAELHRQTISASSSARSAVDLYLNEPGSEETIAQRYRIVIDAARDVRDRVLVLARSDGLTDGERRATRSAAAVLSSVAADIAAGRRHEPEAKTETDTPASPFDALITDVGTLEIAANHAVNRT
ncbi:MAG: FUSC family protein [Rubrobacteraceae bacterium]